MVDFPAFKISLNATHVHSKISFSRNKKFGWSTTLSSRCQDARNIIPKKVDRWWLLFGIFPFEKCLSPLKIGAKCPYKCGWLWREILQKITIGFVLLVWFPVIVIPPLIELQWSTCWTAGFFCFLPPDLFGKNRHLGSGKPWAIHQHQT